MWAKHRDTILWIYAIGNAVTFAQLVRAQVPSIETASDITWVVLKALAIACAWPVYWPIRFVWG